MSATGTARIVVDVQESFRHRHYYRDTDVPAFVERLQALVDGAKKAGIPVVQIFHVEDNGVFAESPANALPLLFDADENAYRISEKPCSAGFATPARRMWSSATPPARR